MSPRIHGSGQHTCPVGQGSFGEHGWRSAPSQVGLGNRRNGGQLENEKRIKYNTSLCYTARSFFVCCTGHGLQDTGYEYFLLILYSDVNRRVYICQI